MSRFQLQLGRHSPSIVSIWGDSAVPASQEIDPCAGLPAVDQTNIAAGVAGASAVPAIASGSRMVVGRIVLSWKFYHRC
jgi:hypothetical protein